MPDFAVSTAFNSSGNILKNITGMDKGVKRFGDSATKSFRKASRGGTQFSSIVKGILSADLVRSGITGLKAGISSAAAEFVNYDQAITSASAKFKGLNTTTVEGQKTLESLMGTARELGATTEFSATQAAQGLDFLAMAGFTTEQAMASLPGVVDLATVAQVDLARATDIASDSLGSFGLMTKDSVQLQKNFVRVNDVFAKTMTTSNTSIEALFESVKSGGSAFTAAGQSMETFSALAGVMANAGIKGSESGTSLRNVMLRLGSPAADAGKVMRQLGIQTQDANGNFRDVIDILGDFEKGLVGMGTAQRTAALSTVFGARSVTGVNILLQEGTEALGDYRDGLIKAGGASAAMAEKIRGSIGNQLASLKSATTELGFQFIDTFKDQIGPAIQGLTTIIRGVDVPGLVENFKSLIDVGLQFKSVLFAIVGGWVAYKAVFAGAALLQGIKMFLLFGKALRAAVVAQGLLNVLMTANPIGLIATAVGLLVGGLILLVTNWDAVSAAFISGIKFIGNAMMQLFSLVLSPANALSQAIKGVVGFLFGGEGEAQVARAAPNEAALAAQQVNFNGQLNIAGAPEGSTFESETTGAPDIRFELAGINQ